MEFSSLAILDHVGVTDCVPGKCKGRVMIISTMPPMYEPVFDLIMTIEDEADFEVYGFRK